MTSKHGSASRSVGADDAANQLRKVIAQLESIRQSARRSVARSHEAEAVAMAAIRRLAPAGTTHRIQAEKIVSSSSSNPAQVEYRSVQVTDPLLGILNALLFDYQRGFLETVEEQLRAGMLSDFLSIAKFLLSETSTRYKDPAAVVVGVVLEEHLRKLASKNGIPDQDPSGKPLKASALNDQLYNNGVFPQSYHQTVTAWLHIRNEAVHANWAAYNEELVRLMLAGTEEFIARYPA
jgi:hypothetical protein